MGAFDNNVLGIAGTKSVWGGDSRHSYPHVMYKRMKAESMHAGVHVK